MIDEWFHFYLRRFKQRVNSVYLSNVSRVKSSKQNKNAIDIFIVFISSLNVFVYKMLNVEWKSFFGKTQFLLCNLTTAERSVPKQKMILWVAAVYAVYPIWDLNKLGWRFDKRFSRSEY